MSKDGYQNEDQETIIQEEDVMKLMQSLPNTTILNGMRKLINYQGLWYPDRVFKNVPAFQRHFQAQHPDLIIASSPKTGNTWLKALLFAIVNRKTEKQKLLNQKHPHELVYYLDNDVYGKAFEYPQPCHLDELPSPRLFHTHVSYHSLPESIKTSECRILYLTRNPFDTFISLFYFICGIAKKEHGDDEYHKLGPPSLEHFIEDCFNGKSSFGPFFDHVLEYWEKSLEHPSKIMFLMYEDLMDDSISQVKRIAEFIGFPLTAQEEREGVAEEIMNLCSFKRLKELDANKSGVIGKVYEKKSYFRKGQVGDWTNHFTPSMVDRWMKIVEEKTRNTGLSFRFNVH